MAKRRHFVAINILYLNVTIWDLFANFCPICCQFFSAICPVSQVGLRFDTPYPNILIGIASGTNKAKKKNGSSRNFQQIIPFFGKLLFQIILCTSDGHLANILFMSGVAASDNSNTVDVVSKVAIICILTCHHTMKSPGFLSVSVSLPGRCCFFYAIIVLPLQIFTHGRYIFV